MSRGARRAGLLAAAAAAALALTAGPAAAADPIMPLSQLAPGTVGEARTVVRGTDIVTFPVRILDVQVASDGPGGALILARAEGPLMEETGGVAEGMSGSPVYVTGADGVPRVIGAIAATWMPDRASSRDSGPISGREAPATVQRASG